MSSTSTSPSSPNSNVHSPSSSPNVSVSLILTVSGNSPYLHNGDNTNSMYHSLGIKIGLETNSWQRMFYSRFQIPSLVGGVFNYYIGLVILELAKREQNDIALVNPNLIRHRVNKWSRWKKKLIRLAWPTFLRILPRMCANRFSPSKHSASRRPLPSIFTTWAYSA